MRLNFDCIRKILLCVESNTGLRKSCFFIDVSLDTVMSNIGDVISPKEYQQELMSEFSNDELIYHVHYCADADLILLMEHSSEYQIFISDLTPKGHEVLSGIREPKQWAAVKKGLSAVRNYSLSALTAVADGITSAGITAYLSGLTNL